ncbi:MAG: hypothetical protein OXH69_04160 [Acidobacteria bacterium]|nr:hypothetical protein [Acidobacteriota bacterium]
MTVLAADVAAQHVPFPDFSETAYCRIGTWNRYRFTVPEGRLSDIIPRDIRINLDYRGTRAVGGLWSVWLAKQGDGAEAGELFSRGSSKGMSRGVHLQLSDQPGTFQVWVGCSMPGWFTVSASSGRPLDLTRLRSR